MINLIVKILLLLLGVYLITIGHWAWALIPLLIVLSMSLAIGVLAFFIICGLLLLVTGCSTVSNDITIIDNSYYHYSVDYKQNRPVRNPNNPYKIQK
jgi:hypothetical protein